MFISFDCELFMLEIKKTRSELKRESILCGAMQCFQQGGVDNTSMDKIAEVAQVSKRTVYNHFSSKEELVAEILGGLIQSSFSNSDVQYYPEQELHSQLVELIDSQIKVTVTKEFIDLVRVAFDHFMNNPDYMQEHFEKYMPKELPVQKWLKKAMKDGKIKPVDLEFATNLLMDMIKGQAFWAQLLQIEPPLTEAKRRHLIEESVAMFLNYYQTN